MKNTLLIGAKTSVSYLTTLFGRSLVLMPQVLKQRDRLSIWTSVVINSKLFVTLGASESENCHTNILKLLITKFLRPVFVHRYFTAAFSIIHINYLPTVYLGNIPQFY